jgi:hypothetical protein
MNAFTQRRARWSLNIETCAEDEESSLCGLEARFRNRVVGSASADANRAKFENDQGNLACAQTRLLRIDPRFW